MTDARTRIQELIDRVKQSIIGQDQVVERLVVALLANGNILIEGLPGLAKTRTARALARNLEAFYSRIQFTPDLLPADITGADVYQSGARGGAFQFQPGPVFANILLADEINRAPAKVQAALLEAMDEHQVTVGGNRHKLPNLFMVIATQSPSAQDGTYPLPEAQLDRFLMQVRMGYPSIEDEIEVLRLLRREARGPASEATRVISSETVFAARAEVAALPVPDALDHYIATLIDATRHPERHDPDLARLIETGVSPRGTHALDTCGRARAWLSGATALRPEDVRDVLADVVRHRIVLSYEAIGAGVTTDQIVTAILDRVPSP